jgi:hypothetical protein
VSDVKLHPPEQLETCQSSRNRSGTDVPCTEKAVALALAGDMVYPVCAFHTRTMTALTIQQALREGWI